MPQKHHEHHQQQQQQQQQALSKGSLVEVSSDEEGFKGAWYVATLLDFRPSSSSRKKKHNPNPNHHKQYYVEYQSLVSEEDPSVPLREYVDTALVRPVPPEETYPKPFELGDVVDAYYRDGWWTGVITKLVEGSRFVVTFQNPPDEIGFGFSNLRFHRHWINGTWLRPVTQRAAGLMFSVGKRVEVSFDREGSLDGWFPATVLEEIGNGFFLVEYQVRYRYGETALLKATIDSHHIRPCPPNLKDKNFFLLEKVDAFCDGGWWSGVITKELADSKYNVFFKHTNKEREFTHLDLRPHMEWKDGKWFTSSQDVLIPSDNQNHEDSVCRNANITEMAVSLGSLGSIKSTYEEKMHFPLKSVDNQVQLLTPCNETSSGAVSSLKGRTLDTPDIVGEEMLREEIPAVPPSPTACQPSTSTIETPREETLCNVAIPNSEVLGNRFSKQSLGRDKSAGNHSWGKRVKRKRMKFGEHEDCPTPSSRKTNDSSLNMQAKDTQTSVGGNECSGVKGAAEDVEKECMTMETNLHIVLGLECEEMRSAGSKNSCLSADEESLKHMGDWGGLNDTELHTVKVTNQFDLGETIQKKRRGRPPKSAEKSSKNSISGEQPSKDVAIEELLVKDCMTNENDSHTIVEVATSTDPLVLGQECVINVGGKKLIRNQIKQKNRSSRMKPMSPLRIPSDEVVEPSVKQHERHSLRRGRKRTINVNIVSQVHDSPNATEGKTNKPNFMTKESEIMASELHNNMLDDQPLSKWFEEMHSPTTVDGSRVSPIRDIEQCVEQLEIVKEASAQSGGQMEIAKETAVANDAHKAVGSELHLLPFVKNTLLWSTVESMEVFRKIPQKPHFRPLKHCKESSREGLAIGCMVTFSSVVERTSRLRFDDPKSTIDDILETLVDLESHGFDAQVVRDRITALLSMKEKQEKLENQVEQLNSEIVEHNLERAKVDEEMDEIKKQIRALQEKLSQAMSLKANKNLEITSLESKLDGMKESIRKVRSDFEELATIL